MAEGRKRFEGTLEQARSNFPPRLILRTADNIDSLRSVPGVVSIKPLPTVTPPSTDINAPIEISYEAELARDADFQLILKSAIDAGIRLSRFEQVTVSLHDIFVSMAGESAGENAGAFQ